MYQLFPEDFFLPCLVEPPFFFGTLAPDLRASESPIAIACFRLVTFLPLLPLRNVPFFFSCIALFTFFAAPFEYFAIVIDFNLFLVLRFRCYNNCLEIKNQSKYYK